MLTNVSQTIAGVEWDIFMRAARVFVEKHGQAYFSFAYRPRADVGIGHADGFSRLGNGELLLFFENRQLKFMDLQSAMVSLKCQRVVISPAHSKQQRNAFRISGVR
ncbi:hypothetical protein TRVL_04175 [Trypanosoma vivax]|nr:hypothetical protein TRVL_04175 [Trypanosoma vivax]